MSWFRRAAPTDSLAVTMTGVQLGNRVLVVGATDVALIAALGTKSGLSGRAALVDADETKLRAAAAAIEREGALVDALAAPWGDWGYENDSFDVAVLRDQLMVLAPDARARCLQGVLRVLRPGGRVIAIESAPRRGLGAMLKPQAIDQAYLAAGGAAAALKEQGFAGVRVLAEREGTVFTEGAKRG